MIYHNKDNLDQRHEDRYHHTRGCGPNYEPQPRGTRERFSQLLFTSGSTERPVSKWCTAGSPRWAVPRVGRGESRCADSRKLSLFTTACKSLSLESDEINSRIVSSATKQNLSVDNVLNHAATVAATAPTSTSFIAMRHRPRQSARGEQQQKRLQREQARREVLLYNLKQYQKRKSRNRWYERRRLLVGMWTPLHPPPTPGPRPRPRP